MQTSSKSSLLVNEIEDLLSESSKEKSFSRDSDIGISAARPRYTPSHQAPLNKSSLLDLFDREPEPMNIPNRDAKPSYIVVKPEPVGSTPAGSASVEGAAVEVSGSESPPAWEPVSSYVVVKPEPLDEPFPIGPPESDDPERHPDDGGPDDDGDSSGDEADVDLEAEGGPEEGAGAATKSTFSWIGMARSTLGGGAMMVVLLGGLLVWLEPWMAAGLAGYLGGRLARNPWNGIMAALSPFLVIGTLILILSTMTAPIFGELSFPSSGVPGSLSHCLGHGLSEVRDPGSSLFAALLTMGFVGGLSEWLHQNRPVH